MYPSQMPLNKVLLPLDWLALGKPAFSIAKFPATDVRCSRQK